MNTDRWAQYYTATAGRAPRKLLLEALAYTQKHGLALDVGAGDLTDSVHLLGLGFRVQAIDNAPASQTLSRTIRDDSFTFESTDLEHLTLPVATFDLISAQFTLPFCKPENFTQMLNIILTSLKPGGIITGQFFGTHDAWNVPDSTMTFHTKEEVQELFATMTLIKLFEEERDAPTASGTLKHWHVFEVIAKK